MQDFWRVEDVNLNGPYRGEVLRNNPSRWDFMMEMRFRYQPDDHWRWNHDTQPAPDESGIFDIMEHEIFGCPSLTLLRAWWNDDQLKDMSAGWRATLYGFRISHYTVEAPHYRMGWDIRQLVADKNHIKLVEHVDIRKLVNV